MTVSVWRQAAVANAMTQTKAVDFFMIKISVQPLAGYLKRGANGMRANRDTFRLRGQSKHTLLKRTPSVHFLKAVCRGFIRGGKRGHRAGNGAINSQQAPS